MKSSQWFLLVAGVLVGFWGGRFWSQQATHETAVIETSVTEMACPVPTADCKELNGFLAKMKDLTPEQIREYLKIQNAEEKLKKADEILGKIMAAMVADVGFKLSQNDLDLFGKTESMTTTTEPYVPSTTLPAAKTVASPAGNRAEANRTRLQIRNATTEAQALSALQSMGSNFSQGLSDSGLMTQEQIRELTGLFEGTLSYDDKRVVRSTLRFNGRLQGDKLQGSAQVQIFNTEGKVVSNGSSRGDLSGAFAGNENSVFIEVGSSYMQLAFFPRLDVWMGNYLESKKGSLVKTGSVVFQKR